MNGAPLPRFPGSFTWGVATSAFQIEGATSEDGRAFPLRQMRGNHRQGAPTHPSVNGPGGGKALLIGGHMDSVPNGGWLDGCLNVMAGVEILRRINEQYAGRPPITIRLIAPASF